MRQPQMTENSRLGSFWREGFLPNALRLGIGSICSWIGGWLVYATVGGCRLGRKQWRVFNRIGGILYCAGFIGLLVPIPWV